MWAELHLLEMAEVSWESKLMYLTALRLKHARFIKKLLEQFCTFYTERLSITLFSSSWLINLCSQSISKYFSHIHSQRGAAPGRSYRKDPVFLLLLTWLSLLKKSSDKTVVNVHKTNEHKHLQLNAELWCFRGKVPTFTVGLILLILTTITNQQKLDWWWLLLKKFIQQMTLMSWLHSLIDMYSAPGVSSDLEHKNRIVLWLEWNRSYI